MDSIRLGEASVGVWVPRLVGLAGLAFGLCIMLVAIFYMAQGNEDARTQNSEEGRIIEVVRRAQEQQQIVKPPEPPPSKPKQAPRAPLPELSSLLAGIDLGIPEFAVDDFAGSAKSLLGDINRGGIMNESLVDAKPRVISRTPLTYPRDALKKGINGYVLLNLLITETGDIESAKILDSEPKGVFDTAALRGIQGWRFAPARYKDQPVKVWAKQRIRFDAQ